MKRIFILLVALCIVLGSVSIPVVAENNKKSGSFYYELKGNGNAVITGFDWSAYADEDVYIPRQVDGYNVSEIGAFAFSSEELSFDDSVGAPVVVVIPDTVTIIGEKAFFGTEIISINIPSSVQFIGSGALAYCKNINQYTVDESNDVFATIDGVLYNKSSKELVAVPYARYNGYDDIFVIPEGIVSIGDYAFYGLDLAGASSSDQGVYLPSSLISIGNHSFENVTFSGLYGTGQKFAGYYSSYKPSTFRFKNTKSIGDYAFANVRSKMAWDFGSLETIGNYAFSSVECNDKDEHRKDEVFSLPSTVREIGIGAFNNYAENQGIKTIDLSNTQLTEIPDYAFSSFKLRYQSAYVNDDLHREIILPEGITSIGAYAFEKIGTDIHGSDMSFYGVFITLPSSIQTIKEHAFDSASIMPTFNTGLKNIDEYAFYNSCLFSDSTLSLPEGIESLGDYSFYAHYLDSLYIPSSVNSIGVNVCDRSTTKLMVESNTYAALYASENGYAIINVGGNDTSWLNN